MEPWWEVMSSAASTIQAVNVWPHADSLLPFRKLQLETDTQPFETEGFTPHPLLFKHCTIMSMPVLHGTVISPSREALIHTLRNLQQHA